ncbi:nucleotidyltransferase family protein [Streptococcus iniae]|uniref:nucleotidyltransferase family protein n=1 Tax=Streptococcus iniae TaxID=1346 RepID=UPI002711E0F6|nr:nucleotidyltransferase family protein [Streptococcus iniae]WKZ89232.1 nucleotidyltransferase family protein [Streptococcus iniae]
MTEDDLRAWILADKDFMGLLQIVEAQQLPDAWVAAGCLRNFIWNKLAYGTGFDKTTDIDLVFFDADRSYQDSLEIEKNLKREHPEFKWEVRNQAYMHGHSPETLPYQSTCDAISKYPETCTALALRLTEGFLEFFIPYGLEVVEKFECRPTPYFLENTKRMELYKKRLGSKKWTEKWPKCCFYHL